MKEWFALSMALLIVTAFPAVCIYLTIWVVPPALRTGRLEARGRYYDRKEQPVRFWLGIVAWLVLSALSIFGFFAFIMGTLRKYDWII